MVEGRNTVRRHTGNGVGSALQLAGKMGDEHQLPGLALVVTVGSTRFWRVDVPGQTIVDPEARRRP
ncbi:hypothetical protein GA0070216_12833 [Micromonospora matsumotoense]|uniref:Uncharacterized protein n=1 Tax=Micromonospora matsumotoense TaxID=121616 RepID=A0A1C5AU89_9ACTN|nr:hypothetical protein [Micromonospora matsumotoense]SCF48733.1 hypothetical protein GA0070216_12833 [Micromonospora matsumotoense]